MSVRQVLRLSLSRHRVAGAVAALACLLAAALVHAVTPKVWHVQAEVLVAESSTTYRLTAPFDAVPRLRDGIKELPEELTSKARLVALVKRVGLIDQWESTRPWPIRLKNQLMEKVRGPVSDVDRLDALVAMLDQKLNVWTERDKVFISCEWPQREVAVAMVQGTLLSLQSLRLERDVKAIESSALALDAQREGVEAEMRQRLEFIEAEQRAAAAAKRWPQYAGATEQLLRDGARRSELWLQGTNTHLRAQAMARSSAHRYVVIEPPLPPRQPVGASTLTWALALLLGAVVSFVSASVLAAYRSGRVVSDEQVTRQLSLPVVGRLQLDWSGVMVAAEWRTVLPGLALGMASGVALAVSRGSPVMALAPTLLVAGAVALWRLPLKWPLLALLLLAVTIDDPTDRPYFNLWRSPLYPLGRIFFTNIAWFTGFELAVMGLGALTLLRRLMGLSTTMEAPGMPGPRPLRSALLLSFLTIGWLVVWGVARGGIFREALWQFRALLFMPMVSMLSLLAFDFPKDLRLLGRVLVIGSVVKALLGTFFMYFIAYPQGEYPPHTTGHNDTMVFVVGVVLALVRVWEWPSWRNIGEALLWLPFLAMALRLNDRRIAYVDIALALGFIYLMSPMHRAKRFVTQAMVAMIPVVVLYVAVGWNARSSVFKPVAKLRSIVAPAADTEEESSNVERDIENFNLLKSWERDPMLGQGFGHAFTEFLPSNDFAQSAFGHIGHNSVLWLLWIGGIFGFFGVWLYLGITSFFFARSLRVVTDVTERVGLLVAMAIIITYLLQAFGDMGSQAMQFVFFVSVAVSIIGRTATRHGQWAPPVVSVVTAPVAANGLAPSV
ncbi:MAG: hypothetical protein JNM69_31110 [Archangium sp.]|nr:hypothetical protein [Archangium sp.]